MKLVTYKHYEIYAIEDLAKTGDNTAKLFRIKNTKTDNNFTYITKLSGTLEAIENIDNKKKYFNAVSHEIHKYLDQGIEIPDTQVVVSTWTREEQKKSGIFYTPRSIVEFIFDILNIYKTDEDKNRQRWESNKPEAHYPSVIDPAAGSGDFLKVAIQKCFTKADWVFGMDIDEAAVNKWKDINLLSEFGGNSQDLKAHFFHQNGLGDIQWSQHIKTFKYKLKKSDIQNQQFDTVVGNPPYGGLGLYEEMKQMSRAVLGTETVETIKSLTLDDLFGGQETKLWKEKTLVDKQVSISIIKLIELFGLSKSLLGLEIWKDKKIKVSHLNRICMINGMEVNLENVLIGPEIEKLKNFPIEVLFIERFIKLAKPGGWIAMVIPDGILTNSNLSYVREFITHKCILEATISLPRDTFKAAKTNAKTSIIILKKKKNIEDDANNYPVFMASIDKIEAQLLNHIITNYNYFYKSNKNTMDNNQKVFTTKDKTGKELITIRIDKTLQDLMSEKPFSRWDPFYWNPKFDSLLKSSKYEIKNLGNFLKPGTKGITYGSTKPRQWLNDQTGVMYIKSLNVLNTGLNTSNIFWTPEGGNLDGEQYRVHYNDIVMNKSGTGTFGRLFVMTNDYKKIVVSQDTMKIGLSNISPSYVAVYLQCKEGRQQIVRLTAGVSGQVHIDFEDIKAILIPILGKEIQHHIEANYLKMSEFHYKAMEAKLKGDESGYKSNLEIAEKKLKELVAKTESVIRGESDDVI